MENLNKIILLIIQLKQQELIIIKDGKYLNKIINL